MTIVNKIYMQKFVLVEVVPASSPLKSVEVHGNAGCRTLQGLVRRQELENSKIFGGGKELF